MPLQSLVLYVKYLFRKNVSLSVGLYRVWVSIVLSALPLLAVIRDSLSLSLSLSLSMHPCRTCACVSIFLPLFVLLIRSPAVSLCFCLSLSVCVVCPCRCIKPNQVKKSRIFETETTLGQMISLSVLEAVAIIHKGFAYRASFTDFVEDNNVLMSVLGAKVVSTQKEKKKKWNQNVLESFLSTLLSPHVPLSLPLAKLPRSPVATRDCLSTNIYMYTYICMRGLYLFP